MGIWKSFKGQVGRDVGKVVSNFLWRDKHASVYRRAESRRLNQLHHDQQVHEAEQKLIKRAMLEQFSYQTDDKIQQLNAFTISKDKDELINTLSSLAILIKANPIKDRTIEAANRISNAYSDAILEKYEQVFIVFSANYPEDHLIDYYDKVLYNAKRLRFVKRHLIAGIGICVLIILIILININDS